jgi:hypothetical protein
MSHRKISQTRSRGSFTRRRRPGLAGVVVVVAGLAIAAAGSAVAPAGRYTIDHGAVTDVKTKLTWQQAASSTTYTQAGAASVCATLSLNGGRWRLPTVKELVTLVDVSVASGPTIDATAFPGTPSGPFWSSTPSAEAAGVAWALYFSGGNAYSDEVSNSDYVRCVR